jgi:hypothetical protein
MTLDVALALLVAALCAAWLVRRGVRALRGGPTGCGRGKAEASPCPQAGAMVDAVRAAARRRGGAGTAR